ncbi:MAG: ABC transporter substrate-binding protein [Thaumarchaeota archaeon]|nr:carbohydrate ABC transporter substrate-binding protein [Nitrososphaerota archaeon]MBI3022623.1 carbohydrate ABC transporter substrate-binding protein [Nitrososphaerota archaeon]MCS4540316.1 ABC transporter substrate-binding protein [Nitrososphaerota archaeon]
MRRVRKSLSDNLKDPQLASLEAKFPQLKTLLSRKVSRRQALTTGAKAAIGVGAVVVVGAAGYVAYTSVSPGGETVTTSPTTTATTTTAPTTGGAKPPFPLKFVHWHYQDAIINSYVERFQNVYGEWVEEEVLDNANYNTLLEAKINAGDKFDMNYQNADAALRLVFLGHELDLEDMPGIAQIKADLYPSITSAYSTIDGKLGGLPYFVSTRSATTANDKILDQYGMSGEYPTTWDELWDIGRKLQAKGLDKPILPHWFAVWYGLVWDLESELGGTFNDPDLTKTYFGKDFKPAFDPKAGPLYDLLKGWQKLYQDNTIDPIALTWGGDGPMVTAFNSGAYAFNPTAIYYFWAANDASQSQIAGSATLVPPGKGLTGVIDTGLYQKPKNNSGDVDRQLRLIKWFGYKDDQGEFLTAKSWFKSDLLNSGYKPVINLKEVQDAIRERMGDKTEQTLKALDEHIARMSTPFVYKSPLYPEWKQDVGSTILPAVVTGSISVEQGLQTMYDNANKLWQKYHGT